MEIMEAATTLGRLIKESEVYRKLDEVKKEYEACSEISSYMSEYDADQKAIEEEAQKENRDMQLIDKLQARLDELFKLVTEHPVYQKLYSAQEAVNQLMEEVNNQITFTITGQMPCTHDCSSCHADCHHH